MWNNPFHQVWVSKETLKNVSLERGGHIFCQQGDLVATVWMDKKPVTLLFTLAQADVTQTSHTLHRESKGMVQGPLCSVLTR